MSETILSDKLSTSMESEKPVSDAPPVEFPPYPEPTYDDFDEDLSQEEKDYYKSKYPDLNVLKSVRLHCTGCDRHLGTSSRNDTRMRSHPMLRTLVCHTCYAFYNSGEFDKGDDGSELYCRWCGQGGQVYCCSNCPHVFCAKCIKRNFGVSKIKEIENIDVWKCFNCNPKCLWDLRALCWALLRFCNLRTKITNSTGDPALKEAYRKESHTDQTVCCKTKTRRREKKAGEELKKKEPEEKKEKEKDVKKKESEEKKEKDVKKTAIPIANVMTKLPPTIQVRKFASINPDESLIDKKPQKRPASPLNKQNPGLVPNPVSQHLGAGRLYPKIIPMPTGPTGPKKIKMPGPPVLFNPIRIQKDKVQTYTRIRPKLLTPVSGPPPHLIVNNQINGFNPSGMFNNSMVFGDNINLSLESLTQGLDMATVAAISQQGPPSQDDVICTPDFPLEPLCEVTEDIADDDVQCITPNPPRKINSPPPLVPRLPKLADVSPENIIQMTENDVTVNAATGGLKFRVDPQTLSSNKMYRLPDGRIFAINANPNMPGGYSATIVAVTETHSGKIAPKGATYAAKLSAVPSTLPKSNSPTTPRNNRNRNDQSKNKVTKRYKSKDNVIRKSDLNVPVEWYRFSLIDATDSLEYSLSKLQKLKKETTTPFLRTRTVQEMRNLHRALDRLLNTSAVRFHEIRENLHKEMKNYIAKKTNRANISEEDDDDVEILNEIEDNDDPIFIDENSMESNNATGSIETQEVDLTEVGSEHNDSAERSTQHHDTMEKNSLSESLKMECDNDELSSTHDDRATITEIKANGNEKKDSIENKDTSIENKDTSIENKDTSIENKDTSNESNVDEDNISKNNESVDVIAYGNSEITKVNGNSNDKNAESEDNSKDNTDLRKEDGEQGNDVQLFKDKEIQDSSNDEELSKKVNTPEISENKINKEDLSEDKSQDAEMSDEMIESLLKGDSGGIDDIDTQNLNCLEDLQDS